MTEVDELSVLFENYSLADAPKISDGNNREANVYKVGNKVARIRKDKTGCLRDRYGVSALELHLHEFTVMKELFDNGVQVPEPHGVFNFNSPDFEDPQIGILMDYIPGHRVDDISKIGYIDHRYASSLMHRELRKSSALGFRINDTGPHNTLWVPSEQKVYIIDVGRWTDEYVPTMEDI